MSKSSQEPPNGMVEMGRLAFREEGNIWSAYWAPRLDSMDDAIFLGSIRMSAVKGFPERRDAFVAMMRGIMTDVIEAETGKAPTWGGEQKAPEAERWGGP